MKAADRQIEGVDVFLRREASIPVRPFDGQTIPCADKSFDAAMFIDVLHYPMNAASLLREGASGKQVHPD